MFTINGVMALKICSGRCLVLWRSLAGQGGTVWRWPVGSHMMHAWMFSLRPAIHAYIWSCSRLIFKKVFLVCYFNLFPGFFHWQRAFYQYNNMLSLILSLLPLCQVTSILHFRRRRNITQFCLGTTGSKYKAFFFNTGSFEVSVSSIRTKATLKYPVD